MSKKISDKAIAKVPAFADRVSLFSNKLQISRYAAGSITDYCHALYKAVLQLGKLPEEFTQQDLDDYLKSMLSRKPLPAEAQFKHFIYGLKCYLFSTPNSLYRLGGVFNKIIFSVFYTFGLFFHL